LGKESEEGIMSSVLAATSSGLLRIDRDGSSIEEAPVAGAFVSRGAGHVYAVTQAADLWRRELDGHWSPLNQAAVREEVWSFAADSRHPGRLYLGVSPALVYRSDDEGATWRPCDSVKRIPGYETWTFPPPPHIPHVRSIAIDGKSGDGIYIGVEEGGVYHSPDGGETWDSLNQGLYWDVHTVAPATAAADDLYATTGAGFHVSRDGGRHWQHVTEGIANSYTVPLLVSRTGGRVFTAAAAGPPPTWASGVRGAIYRSDDGGLHWRQLEDGLPAQFVSMISALLEDDAGCLYAASGGDIYASDDAGQSWSQIAGGLGSVRSLAVA
jgi:photosystem II stability/assembly factor-like uncharacterized protein